MEAQALPLSPTADSSECAEQKISPWAVLGNTLGLGLFLLSLLAFFELLSQVPGI